MKHNHETGVDTAKCDACVQFQFQWHDVIVALGGEKQPTRQQYLFEFLIARIIRLENEIEDLKATVSQP